METKQQLLLSALSGMREHFPETRRASSLRPCGPKSGHRFFPAVETGERKGWALGQIRATGVLSMW